MKFNLIVAACENYGIGINGKLPWKLKDELRYFNRITKRKENCSKKNALIMGRKTYFGIPESKRPLSDRITIVLTRNSQSQCYPEGVIVCSSLDDAVFRLSGPHLRDLIENIWVVGGSSVYKEAMNSSYCHRLYFTKIKATFDCDTFFPPISNDFKAVSDDENVPRGIQEENGVQYEFLIFEKQLTGF